MLKKVFITLLLLLFVFAVPVVADAPTVTTDDVDVMSETSVIFYGELVKNGGYDVIDTGFNYWTSDYSSKGAVGAGSMGANKGGFSAEVHNLKPGATYHYQAYAVNTDPNQPDSYGIVKSFNTLGGHPGDFSITSPDEGDELKANSAFTVRWSASDGAEGYLVAFRDLTTNEKYIDNVDVGSDKKYRISASMLTPGHQYRFAVCAYIGENVEWRECEFSVEEIEETPVPEEPVNPPTSNPEQNPGNVNPTPTYPSGDSGQNSGNVDVPYEPPVEPTITDPGVPKITSPSNGASFTTGSSITVRWSAPSSNPDSYNILMSKNYAGSYSNYGIQGTSLTIPASYFTDAGIYELKIYAVKNGHTAVTPASAIFTVYQEVIDTPTVPVQPEQPVVPTTQPTQPKPTPNENYENTYAENNAGSYNTQLGSQKDTSAKNPKIERVKVDIHNGLFGTGYGCVGDYTVIVDTNHDVEKIQIEISGHGHDGDKIISKTITEYKDKWGWWVRDDYRQFTWSPNVALFNDELWLHDGYTYTLRIYLYDDSNVFSISKLTFVGTQKYQHSSLI